MGDAIDPNDGYVHVVPRQLPGENLALDLHDPLV